MVIIFMFRRWAGGARHGVGARWAVAALVGGLLASPVLAQEPSEPTLEGEEAIEITVEGTSEGQRRRQSAESVQVLDTEHVRREAADLGETLARTEGVGVRRSGGLGSATRFSLAGLTDEQIRFFVDGVPLELAGFGPELSNVPVNLVQGVELYQGVVPIRFGTDALGGAVQLLTDSRVQGTGAAVSYQLGSFDTHRLTASARHLDEPSGLLLRAQAFLDDTRNDYPIDVEVADESGRLVPARVHRFHDAYRAWGGGFEAGFLDKPWARRLLLRVFANAYEKELQHNITMDVPYGAVTTGALSAGATLRYGLRLSRESSAELLAGYTFRHTRFDDLGTCAYDWFGRCVRRRPQPGEIESRAVERRVDQGTGFARLHLEWVPSDAQTLRVTLAPTSVTRTGEDLQLRALGQTDPLTPGRGLFSLVTGLEYTLAALQGRLENVVFLKDYLQLASARKLLPEGIFTPVDRDLHGVGVGDGVRVRLGHELYAKASYELATRLPRPDEIFGDGLLVNDNLDLKPEHSHNLNLELAFDGTPGRAGTMSASVVGFGRFADQLIVLIGRENFFTYQNVFMARCLGVAGMGRWTSPGQYLALEGNITWQDFRNTSSEGAFGFFEGQRIPNRPYFHANGSARLQASGLLSSQDELSLTWHVRYVHAFFRSWEGVGQKDTKQVIPSQLLHSLALSYVIRGAAMTLGWTVDVENLTDAPAYDFFGVQRPGRGVFAKLLLEH
ncbi:TonB-dependent siderophore myxochelin receptor MxcH [Vitiosangium sp. GDMCC 1.1324]|uniref:TonB-dependent siderophore myxochelin receptor MxcH n=1 Tax=Vitiosangium sp. (strain GDMCC 1.1324) TaxID=2138576 RepID=UPI001E31D55C|nr:TonB-dependent siderophore myxochelin receptor MxcH [Vitiosangium sp. GDMCC 1.1324]